MKTSVNWICDLKAPSGYGRASRADLRALIKAGIIPSVTIHNHDKTQMDFDKGFWATWEEQVLRPTADLCDITVWQETPEFYRPDPLTKDVARIEWETSRIVDYDHSGNRLYNWVAQLNRMKECWPASDFVGQVLKESGVKTPCYTIPHPTDLEMFCPGERTIIGNNTNKDRFTVLCVFQRTVRKSPDEILLAWSKSKLGKSMDCCLLLKTYGAGFSDPEARLVTSQIAGFRSTLNIRGLKPNVYPITWLIPDDRMPDLYRAADVHLCAARGEGFSMPCHPPNTIIYTPTGPKNIEDVKDNDEVWTHTGGVHVVTGTTMRDYTGQLVAIYPQGTNVPVECTPNHKMLVHTTRKKMRYTKNGSLPTHWVAAKDLHIGDYMVVPRYTLPQNVTTLRISDLVPGLSTDGEYVYYPMSFNQGVATSITSIARLVGCKHQYVARVLNGQRAGKTPIGDAIRAEVCKSGYHKPEPVKIPDVIQLTPDTMELFGLYIAEGSLISNMGGIQFASHRDEQDIRDLELRVCASVFGCTATEVVTHDPQESKRGVVSVSSKILATLFSTLFGSGAENKRIPPALLQSPNLRFLLRGYFRGDGYIPQMSASTASRTLWADLYTALNILGIYAARNVYQRNRPCFPEHTIHIYSQFQDKVETLLGLHQICTNKSGRKNRAVVVADDAFYIPIRKITHRQYAGPVYNMHVDTDQSYMAHGYASHNCAESMACGVPSIYADNTAPHEFAVGYPVKCNRQPVHGMPHIPWYSAEQDWWVPDVYDMIDKLEQAYEDWQTGRIRELGKTARKKAEELHSDERVGALLKERIAALS